MTDEARDAAPYSETPDGVFDIGIAAPVERVWRALTTAKELRAWRDPAVEVFDARPGGAYRVPRNAETGEVESGEILVFTPPHHLRLSWRTTLFPGIETVSEFIMAAVKSGCMLAVADYGFEIFEPDDRHHFLQRLFITRPRQLLRLKKYCERETAKTPSAT